MALDVFDTTVYLVLSVISTLASGFVLLTYISSKALRKHPSSLLAWLATWDVLMNYHTIVWAVGTRQYIQLFAMDYVLMVFTGGEYGRLSIEKVLCFNNNIILGTALVASICYNIAICVDLILTLWNPLAPGYKRAKYYHCLSFIIIAYCSFYINYINNFAASCSVHPSQRMEVPNSGTVGILLAAYLVISLSSVVYAAWRFYRGLGVTTKVRKRYLQRHVAYVIAYWFCWVWPALSGLDDKIGKDSYTVTEIAVVTTSLSGCLLSVIRSSEPLVWARIRSLCRKRQYDQLEMNTNSDMYDESFADCLKSEMNGDILQCLLVCIRSRLCMNSSYSLDYRLRERISMTDIARLSASRFQADVEFAGVELIDYSPGVFRDIRERAGVTAAQLEAALDLSANLDCIAKARESSGKSGSFMFVNHDKSLVIKTIPDREKMLLEKKLLKPYHERLMECQNSLLCRYFGLFTLKITGVSSVDIVVMEGLLRGVVNKRKCYDLKGSTYKRTAHSDPNSESYVLLDLDLWENPTEIRVKRSVKEEIMRTLEGDVELLSKLRIMDYSLLLCIDASEGIEGNRGVYPSFDGDFRYHLGVIDIFTVFNSWKVIENKFKTLVLTQKSNEISAVHPDQYATRFLNFLKLVLLDETEKSLLHKLPSKSDDVLYAPAFT